MSILIFCATSASNADLAENIKKISDNENLTAEIVNLEELDLPLFTPARKAQGIPETVAEITNKAKVAKGFVFCGPEYNGSMPPVFNNMTAWISTSGDSDWRAAFNGKFVLLGSSSGGAGIKYQTAMGQHLGHIGAIVLPRMISVNANKPFNPVSAGAIVKSFLGLIK